MTLTSKERAVLARRALQENSTHFSGYQVGIDGRRSLNEVGVYTERAGHCESEDMCGIRCGPRKVREQSGALAFVLRAKGSY